MTKAKGSLRLSAETVAQICSDLKQHGKTLREIPTVEIAATLGKLATCWLTPDFPQRLQALRELPTSTGFPQPVVEQAIDNLFGELGEEALRGALESELCTTVPYDPVNRKERAFACGPSLTFHILAGNIPGVGIFGLIAALLLKTPCLVKCSSRELILPTLFAESLKRLGTRAAEAIARALAVVSWPGGQSDLEKAAVAHSDCAIVYGGADAIASFSRRTRGNLLPYGPRFSVGIVLQEAGNALSIAAKTAAREMAFFDQRGCLSPLLFFVERDCDAERFARMLADGLRDLSSLLPRSQLSLDEAAQLRRFVERCRWKNPCAASRRIFLDQESLQWVVALLEDPDEIILPPGNRSALVLPVSDPAEMTRALGAFRGEVEAVGVSGPIDRLGQEIPELSLLGVSRLCSLSQLQRPLFSWPQGGFSRLGSLARWIAIEPPEKAAKRSQSQ